MNERVVSSGTVAATPGAKAYSASSWDACISGAWAPSPLTGCIVSSRSSRLFTRPALSLIPDTSASLSFFRESWMACSILLSDICRTTRIRDGAVAVRSCFSTTIIGALLVVAIWMPSTAWPQWVQCIWLTMGTILLFSTWGTYDMAFSSMGYELSDDYNDRTRVFAIRGIYWGTAMVLGGFYYSAAIRLGRRHSLAFEVGFMGVDAYGAILWRRN